MSSPLEIPAPGEPLDVARNVAYHDDVEEAVQTLMAALKNAAKENGLNWRECQHVISGSITDLDLSELITTTIEERVVEVLSSRGSDRP